MPRSRTSARLRLHSSKRSEEFARSWSKQVTGSPRLKTYAPASTRRGTTTPQFANKENALRDASLGARSPSCASTPQTPKTIHPELLN